VAAHSLISGIDRLSRYLGGPRILALPLLRALALVAAFAWLALAPPDFPSRAQVGLIILGFLAYSGLIYLGLWARPAMTLRRHNAVLAGDLAFALALIWFTGGARSAMFLALLVIAGLQSYYYGLRHGMIVAGVTVLAYLAVTWPTLVQVELANFAIRTTVLLGTAIGAGVLAEIEERERLRIGQLSREAVAREQFIRSVVESLREGVIILDREGRVSAWNLAMERRYAIPREEVLGRLFVDLFPNFKREGLVEPLEKLLRGESEEFTLEGFEHDSLRKGRVILNLKGSLLREQAAPAGAVLLVEDITERVGLERSARQAERLAALGTLAAGLAHELGNPIGIISSRIELMLMEAEPQRLPAELQEDLRVLHRHAQRVARVAQRLLSFSRQRPGERRPVDLNHVVEETLLLVEKQVTKEGIRMRRSLAQDLPPLWGDDNALQQVVLNLLTNAREAMAEGGEIRIETGTVTDRPGWLRLTVQDTGPGIPLEALPKIFDPFYTTKPEGTGLGLAVSYGIIRDHQGTIDVRSEPGKGTTFILTFPSAAGANA
jgi:PAS domain S-box-containing protein